jgi:hypothetical protein
MAPLRFTILLAALALLAAAPCVAQPRVQDPFAGFAEALTDPPDPATLTVRGGLYVPAYHQLRFGIKGKLDFSITLSIQNTSEDKVLVLERIDYFNSAGTLLQKYLAKPIALRPFGTVEIFVAKDERGAPGANFLVGWAAAGAIAEPVAETVMIGSQGSFGYSFSSQGRSIRPVGAP